MPQHIETITPDQQEMSSIPPKTKTLQVIIIALSSVNPCQVAKGVMIETRYQPHYKKTVSQKVSDNSVLASIDPSPLNLRVCAFPLSSTVSLSNTFGRWNA